MRSALVGILAAMFLSLSACESPPEAGPTRTTKKYESTTTVTKVIKTESEGPWITTAGTMGSRFRLVHEKDTDARMYLHCLDGGVDWRALVVPNQPEEDDHPGILDIAEGMDARLVLQNGIFYSMGDHGSASALSPAESEEKDETSRGSVSYLPCIRTTRIKVTAEGTEFVVQVRKSGDEYEDRHRVIAGTLASGAKVTIDICDEGEEPITSAELDTSDTYVEVTYEGGEWTFTINGDGVADDPGDSDDAFDVLTFAREQAEKAHAKF